MKIIDSGDFYRAGIGLMSCPFLLLLQICRRYELFAVRKTTENDSRIFAGYGNAFLRTLLLYRREKADVYCYFDIHADFFPEWSLIPGPLCRLPSSKWMMELLLIRQISPWQKTVRTYCCRTPQKIRNCFSLSFLLF